MNFEELQNEINKELLDEINRLRQDIDKLRGELSELTRVVGGINERSLTFVPHIMSGYMTLLETEFADKMQVHFKEFNRQVSETKGEMILNRLSDDTPEQ